MKEKTYIIKRSLFASYEWYDIIKIQEELPDIESVINIDTGDIADEYIDLFNVDSYELRHSKINITYEITLSELLLNSLLTNPDMDDDIYDTIYNNLRYDFIFEGINDESGFRLSFYDSYSSNPIHVKHFLFSDYNPYNE